MRQPKVNTNSAAGGIDKVHWQTWFRVFGKPKGQPRIKAVHAGGFTRVYTPKTADEWKHAVHFAALAKKPPFPLQHNIMVVCRVWMPRPQRLMAKKHSPDPIPTKAKPDIDNLAKAILDGMASAGYWRDDAEIFSVVFEKFYAGKTQQPGATIEVFDLTDEEAKPEQKKGDVA